MVNPSSNSPTPSPGSSCWVYSGQHCANSDPWNDHSLGAQQGSHNLKLLYITHNKIQMHLDKWKQKTCNRKNNKLPHFQNLDTRFEDVLCVFQALHCPLMTVSFSLVCQVILSFYTERMWSNPVVLPFFWWYDLGPSEIQFVVWTHQLLVCLVYLKYYYFLSVYNNG